MSNAWNIVRRNVARNRRLRIAPPSATVPEIVIRRKARRK